MHGSGEYQKEMDDEEFSFKEKQEIVDNILNGVACQEDVKKYKIRMRVNPLTDNTYPIFYIPPYNGNKKLRLTQGSLPKTHILYANQYELEITVQRASVWKQEHMYCGSLRWFDRKNRNG